MSSNSQAILGTWSIDLWPVLGLGLSALVYLRGWRVLNRVLPERFPGWRAGAFLAGLGALFVAVASPLDALSGFLLSAHMVQHLLLMSAAAPLLLLGSPLLPLLRGLPRAFAHDGIGPFLSSPGLQRFGHWLTHPVVGWIALVAGLCVWHVPAAFELALRSPAWHEVEHATFFFGALLFWWPVIRPFPSRPVWPLWTVPLYLLAADIVNTALCAILSFSEHVLYPTYASAPRLFGTSALSDQASAGVIMWVPGSIAFLVPATIVAIQYLSAGQRLMLPVKPGAQAETVPVRLPPARFDLLSIPGLGRIVRTAAFRRTAQGILLLLASAVIVDGFRGPSNSASNLAGFLPWTVGRSIAVVALLAAGNLFCFACPFMLPRELGRKLGMAVRDWPQGLRSKWLAVALLVSFFAAYEAFDLWNRPYATALLVLGYFVAATVVDSLFRGASFCKYVCPIGQFNFVTSLVSPLEVKVREPDVCATCRTHDCLRGNETRRGCELELNLPRKAGNLDCTFCLDCVRACPHDNIGILAVAPALELRRDPVRSSIGRLSQRPDLAALAVVVVFAGFASAAVMTVPVADWMSTVRSGSRAIPMILFAAVTLGILPALALVLTAGAGRWWAGVGIGFSALLCRFSLALVPLGASMWAAHLIFHLLAASPLPGPFLQRVAPGLDWSGDLVAGIRFLPDTLLALQTLILGVGLLISLHTGWHIARDLAPGPGRWARLFAPWSLLALTLYGIGVWSMLQPMPLRGLFDIPLPR